MKICCVFSAIGSTVGHMFCVSVRSCVIEFHTFFFVKVGLCELDYGVLAVGHGTFLAVGVDIPQFSQPRAECRLVLASLPFDTAQFCRLTGMLTATCGTKLDDVLPIGSGTVLL